MSRLRDEIEALDAMEAEYARSMRQAKRNPGVRRRRGGLTVKPTRIIGTDHVVFSVWEPYAGHSTMSTIDGKGMGRLGTRRIPPELEALRPGSDERIRRVGEWYEAQYREAYRAIVLAYPEVSGGTRDMGEISVTDHALAVRLDPHKWRGE